METNLNIEIGGKEFEFTVTESAYISFINGVTMDDKVAPAYGLINDCVKPDQRDDLKAVINPAVAMKVSSALVKDYQGEVTVTVKK